LFDACFDGRLHGRIASARLLASQLARQAQRQENGMAQSTSKMAFGRRQFLHALGVAAAATGSPLLTSNANADSETLNEKRKTRYQESNHVKTFYRVNAYPR
jgi:secreted PhoX family phosphatase